MVSISDETAENQSHQISTLDTIQKQQLIQQELIKSIQLYHSKHYMSTTMSTKSSASSSEKTTPTAPIAQVDADVDAADVENSTAARITKETITKNESNKMKTIASAADDANALPAMVTSIKHVSKSTKPPPKSAVTTTTQRSIEIEIEKNPTAKSRNLKLELKTTGSKNDEMIKSPKTPKTPKSPLSTAGRLSHQTSLSSQIDVVEDRKTLRDALYQGIFHRHRKTIFAMGSFLRMLRSRNSQYNTIRSSSEGEDIDDAR